MEQITNEVDLFALILQQTFVLNEFDCKFVPLASIKPGEPMEFNLKGADNLYLDFKELSLLVNVNITNAVGTKLPNAATVSPVNLSFYSLFRKINEELNSKQVSEPKKHVRLSSVHRNFRKLLIRGAGHATPARGLGKRHGRAHHFDGFCRRKR